MLNLHNKHFFLGKTVVSTRERLRYLETALAEQSREPTREFESQLRTGGLKNSREEWADHSAAHDDRSSKRDRARPVTVHGLLCTDVRQADIYDL